MEIYTVPIRVTSYQELNCTYCSLFRHITCMGLSENGNTPNCNFNDVLKPPNSGVTYFSEQPKYQAYLYAKPTISAFYSIIIAKNWKHTMLLFPSKKPITSHQIPQFLVCYPPVNQHRCRKSSICTSCSLNFPIGFPWFSTCFLYVHRANPHFYTAKKWGKPRATFGSKWQTAEPWTTCRTSTGRTWSQEKSDGKNAGFYEYLQLWTWLLVLTGDFYSD